MRSIIISGTITILLFLVAILPGVLAFIGIALNAILGCDIRDEGGTAYGDCSEGTAGIVYGLLMMPWLLLVTLPFAGIPCLIALAVTMFFAVKLYLKKRLTAKAAGIAHDFIDALKKK